MAQGGVTVPGLSELKRDIDALPSDMTHALAGIASATAHRIAAHAASILRSKTHGTGRTAASIHVIEELAQKQYVVSCPGHIDDPPNLPLWLEHGTRHMAARPYMRPAGDAEEARYIADMTSAAEIVVKDAMP